MGAYIASSSNPSGSVRGSQPRSRMKSARPCADGFANTTPSDGAMYPCALAEGALRKIDTARTAMTWRHGRMTSPLRGVGRSLKSNRRAFVSAIEDAEIEHYDHARLRTC